MPAMDYKTVCEPDAPITVKVEAPDLCPRYMAHYVDVYKRQENPSLGMVQLYYFPAKTANAKYAIVVPGNGSNTTAELNEGASIANQLHELGYAAFVLRCRSFLNASDNAPLYDIANAVK